MAEATASASSERTAGGKGLRPGVLGLVSSTVIGVASTAPAYSLAATLGFVIAVVGVASPAVLLAAFTPMACIAAAYYHLNRADPDCGTTFSWVTRALGPRAGWLGGWGVIVADVVVMANLAQIAGQSAFRLVGAEGLAGDTVPVTVLGVVFIAAMTWICYVGIELCARTQLVLLALEILALVVFAAVALLRVGFGHPAGSLIPSPDWLNPLDVPSGSAFVEGILLAVFIYWGWDSAVAVNEESADATRTPGRAAVLSTVLLLGIYLVVSVAALAFGGVDRLANRADVFVVLAHDVLGSPLDKLLIVAVLTSAVASCQTTILPTARTALSMAAKGAVPGYWRRINPRGLTPSTATVWMGVLSGTWFAGIASISQDVLLDSLLSLGLLIAFYYGLTGLACVVYYRRHLFRRPRNFVFMGLLPLLGSVSLFAVLVKSCLDLADPAKSASGDSWFGFGPPLVIGVAFAALGVALMVAQSRSAPEFFRRRRETATDAIAAGSASADTVLTGDG